jgi:ferrous iron transport protein B
LFGRASAAAAPVFEPLGFGNWESTGALAGGFIAKEIVVSTMSQIYAVEAEAEAEADVSFAEDLAEMVSGLGRAALEAGKALISVIPGVNLAEGEEEVEDTALSAALRAHFTTLGAVAFVVFVLLYVPCVATLGAIRHEYGTRWAVFSAGFQLSLAWGVALVVFQGGRILGM